MVMNKFVALIFCFLVGCGRYAPPLAPEALAPHAVEDLQTTAKSEGVYFAWTASRHDVRGRDLKSIDGYRIYRKEIFNKSDVIDPNVEYLLVTTIQDRHVEDLKIKR